MKTYARWAGAALVAGWLGCGGQVDESTGSTGAGGHAGSAAGTGGTGSSGGSGQGPGGAGGQSGGQGPGGVGGQVSGGQGPGGQAPDGAGGVSGGSGVCWAELGGAGQGGAGQGGAGQGGAGQGGQGGEMLAGCDWYEQLLAKAKAKAPPCSLHGLHRILPDGSTEPLPIMLPSTSIMPHPVKDNASPEEISWKDVWSIVTVTDAYVFLSAWTPDHYQLLVAVSTTPGVPAVVIDADVLTWPKAYQTGVLNEVPGWLYYMQTLLPEGAKQRIRRVSLTDPKSPPETVFEGEDSSFLPGTVIHAGDDTFLGSREQLLRVRGGKVIESQLLVTYWLYGVSGFAVIGDRLLHVYHGGGSGVLSDLVSQTITDEKLVMLGSQKISSSSIMVPVLDAAGKPAIGMIALGGLVTIPMETPVPMPVPISVVWKAPTYDVEYFRSNHLEYGKSGVEPGYFVDVKCGPSNQYAPAFVTTKGELRLRANEPGFPFVQPTPWANPTFPEDPARLGNTDGVYTVFD